MYACENPSYTLLEERRLSVLEYKVFRTFPLSLYCTVTAIRTDLYNTTLRLARLMYLHSHAYRVTIDGVWIDDRI
jgi:hypothetical protein